MTDTLTASEHEPVRVERMASTGEVVDTVELDGSIFGRTPNVPLLHQVVTAQLAARRSGTHSTRTRAEVRGGGAKPYRQKGTGRARQGTIRAPQFEGGGVALGPKPRSYAQRTPRKMTRLALYGALSDRAKEGRVCVVDGWGFETPRTKDAIAALSALEITGNVLVVIGADDWAVERSFSNLPEVDLVEAAQLTAYDVMANDWIVFTTDTVPGGVTPVEGSAAAKKATANKAAAAKKTAKAARPWDSEPMPASDSEPTPASDSEPTPASASASSDETASDADAGDAGSSTEAAGDDAETATSLASAPATVSSSGADAEVDVDQGAQVSGEEEEEEDDDEGEAEE
jgi:large subunit ribosomal protein L4